MAWHASVWKGRASEAARRIFVNSGIFWIVPISLLA